MTPKDLRRFRLDYDLSRRELARLFGVSVRTVRAWETPGDNAIPEPIYLITRLWEAEPAWVRAGLERLAAAREVNRPREQAVLPAENRRAASTGD